MSRRAQTPRGNTETYLVTGGAGFIGSHLLEALLGRGHRVRVLDNFSTGRRANLPASGDLELLEGDVRDLEVCRRAATGCSGVFHQAALGSVPRSVSDPATTDAVNATGTLNLFLAAREASIERVVYASSSSVYGSDTTLPKTEERLGEPLSPYAASKRSNELLAAAFANCFGMTLVGLRYFNVYGPRQDPNSQYAAVIPLFFRAALSGHAATIHGDGEQTRDFTFVSDVVEANLAAMEYGGARQPAPVFNIGAGARTSINLLWETICEIAGGRAQARHGPPRNGDVRDSLADISRARSALDYRPRFGIREGLTASADFYRSSVSR
jgi:nucleoside-diphosphate-sugar epimerase